MDGTLLLSNEIRSLNENSNAMNKIFCIHLIALLMSTTITSAQTYTVPWAQVQPAWVFPLWFEDGSGDRDTLYFCYDSGASDSFPNTDTMLGEKVVLVDSSKFWTGLWSYNGLDSSVKAYVSNQPFAQLFFNKGIYPLTVRWDDTLLYSSALPYPDLSPFPRARIAIICSSAFGSCPSDVELSITAEPGFFPFPLIDSAVFNGLPGYYVGNTLGEFTMKLKPFDSPIEDEVEVIHGNDASVFPTLVDNHVTILTTRPMTLRFYDLSGRVMLPHLEISPPSGQISTSILPPGAYLMLLQSESLLQVVKIIKR
jgi:hypothetical protein